MSQTIEFLKLSAAFVCGNGSLVLPLKVLSVTIPVNNPIQKQPGDTSVILAPSFFKKPKSNWVTLKFSELILYRPALQQPSHKFPCMSLKIGLMLGVLKYFFTRPSYAVNWF